MYIGLEYSAPNLHVQYIEKKHIYLQLHLIPLLLKLCILTIRSTRINSLLVKSPAAGEALIMSEPGPTQGSSGPLTVQL